jgi:hypothetical protein
LSRSAVFAAPLQLEDQGLAVSQDRGTRQYWTLLPVVAALLNEAFRS